MSPTAASPAPAELEIAAPVKSEVGLRVVVGPTGVAVADPPLPPLEPPDVVIVPLLEDDAEVEPVTSGIVTVERVLVGQYVVVYVCVVVVPSVTQVVVTVEVIVVLAVAEDVGTGLEVVDTETEAEVLDEVRVDAVLDVDWVADGVQPGRVKVPFALPEPP
jgi:hypothetical protein